MESHPSRHARDYEALVASVLLTQRRRRRLARAGADAPMTPAAKTVPAPDPLTGSLEAPARAPSTAAPQEPSRS